MLFTRLTYQLSPVCHMAETTTALATNNSNWNPLVRCIEPEQFPAAGITGQRDNEDASVTATGAPASGMASVEFSKNRAGSEIGAPLLPSKSGAACGCATTIPRENCS